MLKLNGRKIPFCDDHNRFSPTTVELLRYLLVMTRPKKPVVFFFLVFAPQKEKENPRKTAKIDSWNFSHSLSLFLSAFLNLRYLA